VAPTRAAGAAPEWHRTAADLELAGIPPVLDLPVGAGLQDHVVTWLTYTTEGALAADRRDRGERRADRGKVRGPLTSNFAEAGGFLARTTGSARGHPTPPPADPLPDAGASEVLEDGWALSPCLRPNLHGFVKLRSRVPTARRGSCTTYLVTEEDRATILAGLRRCLEIADQPALRSVTSRADGAPAGDDDDASLIDHIERKLDDPVPTRGDLRDGFGGRR